MRLTEGILRRRLTDDERVPMAIGAQDEMGGHGRAVKPAMHLDLEQSADLGRHVQMRPVFIQPHIAAHGVLAQLDAMPAIRGLEPGKTTGKTEVFPLKVAFERLAEPVRQRLHSGGGHLLAAVSLEAARQVVLRRERTVRTILRFQRRQHLVVHGP